MEKNINNEALQIVSMEELYDTVYPPREPIVDGLLYAGTYLFVGAPKVGKSFFMAQLGYHVSRGLDLWNYPVEKGTVLYLALEDDYARLQKRLSRMFGIESSENFFFATQSKNLNEGLEEQLERFVTEHKDARLIIIDTLQKVRERKWNTHRECRNNSKEDLTEGGEDKGQNCSFLYTKRSLYDMIKKPIIIKNLEFCS